MFHLGFMYYAGMGAPGDYTEAARLFSMAAEELLRAQELVRKRKKTFGGHQ
jgi:TPR repeat protein